MTRGLLVCGLDEAGRGPLAGPVFAACVILREDDRIEGLADSKVLSHKRREELAFQIRNRTSWKTSSMAAIRDPARSPDQRPSGTPRESTVRISTNEPTYGGMLALAPPSSHPSAAISSAPGPSGPSAAISAPPGSLSDGHGSPLVENPARDERPEEATLVRIERPLEASPAFDIGARYDGEKTVHRLEELDKELERMAALRTRKTWVMVSIVTLLCLVVFAVIFLQTR